MVELKRRPGRPPKNANEQATEPEQICAPVEPEVVSKAQFEALQETYKAKCAEYERLYSSYRALIYRFNEAGAHAKDFVKTALVGVNLLFPENKKEI